MIVEAEPITRYRSKAVAKFADEKTFAIAKAAELDETADAIEALSLPGVHVSMLESGGNPYVYVWKKVADLRQAGDILRALAGIRLHIIPYGDTAFQDHPESGRRDYRLTGNVSLTLWVPDEDSGARCYRRKVGTQVVDKYEIVCGEPEVQHGNAEASR